MTHDHSIEDGEALLNEIVRFFGRFVVFATASQPVALALWVIHTYAFGAADATAYLLITSPEKRSGKSRLLEVLELLVARPWRVSGASEAVLFRKIAKDQPALLLDEVDAVFGTYAEKTEPLRAAINSGNRRGGYVARCVGPQHDVENFAVFCPKCLAGIDTGRLPETIRDRSIPIGLQRKLDEPVERFRYRKVKPEAEGLVERITAWAREHLDLLRDLYPEIPEELNDRAADGWEPLFAIADLLGGECPPRARRAALELSGDDDLEEDSWGVQLLADLREIWTQEDIGEKAKSALLCGALKQLDDRPWGGWGKGRAEQGLTQRDLSLLLRRYGIKSKTVRQGGMTAKGYHREQFADAWARYVPERADDEEMD